jgi:UDPglucose 6-dehydrogenase
MNVSIIGTGYVGLTTGTCLAFLGHKVTCIDSDEKKIALLRAGKTPIYEPYLTELLAEAAPIFSSAPITLPLFRTRT